MKIELTPRLEQIVKAQMQSGVFASEAEALEHFLDQQIDPDTGLTIGTLRAELQKGLDDIAAGRTQSAEEAHVALHARIQSRAAKVM
jgi:predicted transcriptional regulator